MPEPRFLLLSDVSEILNISSAQTYALVRSGDLVAIQVGGRNQWRVERDELEKYIQRCYAQTRERVSRSGADELAELDERGSAATKRR